jgi:hypothetical protein
MLARHLGDHDGVWTHSLDHAQRTTCHVMALRSALSPNGVSARPELEGDGGVRKSGGEGLRVETQYSSSTRALAPCPVVFAGRNADPQL